MELTCNLLRSCSPLLSLNTPPPSVKVLEECDSVLVPCDTLLRDTSSHTSVLFINSQSEQVNELPKLEVALPFWTLLQHQGNFFNHRFTFNYDRVHVFFTSLKEVGFYRSICFMS